MKTIPLTMAAALVFWGHQTGYLIPACFMGVVIELARVLKTRWEPSLDQVNKISDTCTVCFAGTIIYFVSLDIETALVDILRYLPVFAFPLIVVQEYSAAGDIDVRSLYLFKKRIMEKTQAVRINLSLAFIIICLISSAAANNRLFPYYPVTLGIIAVVLFFQRTKGADIRIWIAAVMVAAIMGFFLQAGVHHAQRALAWRAWHRLIADNADPMRGRTALGKIGRLKLSNKIIFRVLPPENDDGSTYLLKEAAYTFLSGTMWSAAQNKFEPLPLSDDNGFITGRPAVSDRQEPGRQQTDPPAPSRPTLTILTRMKRPKWILRAPEKALEINCPTVSGVYTNGLGTFMVDDAPGFMIYDIRYGDPGTKILPPGKLDLFIPDREKALFQTIAVELGLGPDKPAHKTLPEIKKYFFTNFSYTLDLKADDKTSPITEFMIRTKAGHCEYFATATVLLLRAAGIPARYVTGYMAFEKSRMGNKIVVRRKHAHAWTEVFVNGRWTFFDTTPPSWTDKEKSHFITTAIPDLFSLMGYGFALLRWGNPETQKKLLWLLVPLGILIIRRLLRKDKQKKKKSLRHEQNRSPSGLGTATPDFYIRKLEKKLIQSGFSRKPHETYEQFFIRIREKAFSLQDVPSLMTVIRIHKQLRFGPRPISGRDMALLKSQTDRLIQKLSNPVNAPQGQSIAGTGIDNSDPGS
ncbi:transglutaminase-like domain-containing protein [Desulfobacter curvatus]|uniref:transglutaminase-like domain-containing protein n=1 Tax=Desulfobacter curvatus TaxID=2290 RepID=UPI00037E4AC9|nr:transglutaminase-like domain-containing protein [Desulfobacter curvatus]